MGPVWYLLAWDLDRDDWRIFRVDRMVPRAPTGVRFRPRAIPEGDVVEYVVRRVTETSTS
uniref:WYL domain-containing protein n=1 Tax=Microbacterium sp. K5D TaxID=2305436 RepID=UPI000AA91F71|nr:MULTISPECIES: WYL domain-containing protein [unclassified Microbacterium]